MNLATTAEEAYELLEEWNAFEECTILGLWLEPPARRLEIHCANLGAGVTEPGFEPRPGIIAIQGVLYCHSGSPLLADGPSQISSVELREFTDFWSVTVYFIGTYEHVTVFARGPLSLEFDDPA